MELGKDGQDVFVLILDMNRRQSVRQSSGEAVGQVPSTVLSNISRDDVVLPRCVVCK